MLAGLAFIVIATMVVGWKEKKIKIHDFHPMYFSCSQDDSGLTHNNVCEAY